MQVLWDAAHRTIAEGRALSYDDLTTLAASSDLVRLGMLADEVRRRRHGARATFVRVAEVSVSSPDVTWPPAAGEVRLTGAPASVDAAVALVQQTVTRAGGVPVSAFALDDLERLAPSASALRALIERLESAGLSAVAEAPLDALQDASTSLQVVHDAGVPIARATTRQARPLADTLPLLRQIKDWQRRCGVIRVFAPLPRHTDAERPSTGYDDVRCIALSRLWLDAVDSIQVDWALYGPKLAQVALLFGADDVDSVSPSDDEGDGRRRAPLEEIRRNISAAGLSPVERNGRWAVVGA